MKRLLLVFLVLAAGAFVGLVVWEHREARKGTVVHVLLDERQGLEPGDPVYLKGFEIGRVEAVELRGGRVWVTVRIRPLYDGNLRRDSTFKVESKGILVRRKRLQAYLINPNSPPLKDGDTVEGVNSSLELALKLGAKRAAQLLQEVSESRWGRQAGKLLEEMGRELEEIDWRGSAKELRKRWQEATQRIAELTDYTEELARSKYRELKPELEELSRELEKLGKSEEARKLRRLLEDLRGTGGEEPADSGPERSRL